MVNIEEKIKEGYQLNINTSNALNNIIECNKSNSIILNKAISLINTNAINHKKIHISLTGKLIDMFLYYNYKLDKEVFNNLIICLMNVVKNCKLDEQLSGVLYNNLSNFYEKKILNKLELVVVCLRIFTHKHYSFNKDKILKCLCLLTNESITKSNLLFNDIEEIILKSFNEKNLEKEIFNILFGLLDKNIDLLDSISSCLLNSLKYKKQEEIIILVKMNISKIENLIINNHINENIVDLLFKAYTPSDFNDIFINSEVIKVFVCLTLNLRILKIRNTETKEGNISFLINLVSKSKIKICEYHLKLIEDTLYVNGCFLLLDKIIEKEEFNLLKKINVKKIIDNLFYDFKNGFNIINKLIKSNILFNNESLINLSNYLYNCNENDNIGIMVKKLLLNISSIQSIPNIVKNKLDIEDCSFEEKNDKNKILLLRDILLNNKMPKRYYSKIKGIIKNKYIEHNFKINIIADIFLHSLKKNEILSNELWEILFLNIKKINELNGLKYTLNNKNSNEFIKKLFYKKLNLFFEKNLFNFFYDKFKDKINFLFELYPIVDFKDILYTKLQNNIIYLLSDSRINETELIKITFWIVKNNLSKKHKKLLKGMIDNSLIKKYLKNIDVEKDFEKNIKTNLYNIILNKQISILCEKCQEKFEQIKATIISYSPIEIEEDSECIIIKYIHFLNNIIIGDNINIKNIFDYIEFFSVVEINDNNEIMIKIIWII